MPRYQADKPPRERQCAARVTGRSAEVGFRCLSLSQVPAYSLLSTHTTSAPGDEEFRQAHESGAHQAQQCGDEMPRSSDLVMCIIGTCLANLKRTNCHVTSHIDLQHTLSATT